MAGTKTPQTPGPLTLDDLPPALRAHVEFCRSKGVDLLSWIDPYRDLPRRPILQSLDDYQAQAGWELKPSEYARRFVEDEDLFEITDALPCALHYWLWKLQHHQRFRVPTLNNALAGVKRFVRAVCPEVGERLDIVQVTRHPHHAGTVLPTSTCLYATEAPAWRRTQARCWYWKERYEDLGALTYRATDAILEQYASLSQEARDMIDPDASDALSMGCPEGRRRSRQLIKSGIRSVQGIENRALCRGERQRECVGTFAILSAVVNLWYEAEGTPTCGRSDEVVARLDAWPERIRVAVGGWGFRSRRRESGRDFVRHIRRSLAKARAAEALLDRRGEVLLDRSGGETTPAAARRAMDWWAGQPAEVRASQSPGNCRTFKSVRTAQAVMVAARDNGLSPRLKAGEHSVERQVWPSSPEEEEYRRLKDEEGWSYKRIAKDRGVHPFRVYEGLWRARVDHDPANALQMMKTCESRKSAIEAMSLFEEGKSKKEVGEVLGKDRIGAQNVIRNGWWWRALERRATELLAAAEDRKPPQDPPGNERSDSRNEDAMLPLKEIAGILQKPYGSLRKRADRAKADGRLTDRDWQEISNACHHQARYQYRLGAIRRLL